MVSELRYQNGVTPPPYSPASPAISSAVACSWALSSASSSSEKLSLNSSLAASASASYIYDGDGNMVKSIVNDVVTYYPGGHYQKEVDGADVTTRKYYTAAGRKIAVRTQVNTDPDTLNWLLGDYLGSTSMATNASRVVVR